MALTPPQPSHHAHLDAALTHTHRLATLGTLTGMIAHEFNNILTPVLSYAQMALEAPADRALSHKALEKAAAGAQRAAHIAEAILELSRECHSTAAVADSCDVATACRAAFGCLAREPRKDGIELQLRLSGAPAVAIRPVSLQQVLLNLIINARKAVLAAPLASPRAITVSAGMVDRIAHAAIKSSIMCYISTGQTPPAPAATAGAWVEITVADTGCGIDPSVLSRLFEPWVTRDHAAADDHAAASDTLVARGTGLGLAMCAELVRSAGGWMWARSTPGQGATVGVVLPAAAR